MKRLEVESMLAQVKEARETRTQFVRDITIGINTTMTRLLHEAVALYMSPDQIAAASGHKVSEVRKMLRDIGLDPKMGKTVVSKKAAAALATNASLLMVEPGELLMSPLAYLPMGAKMRRELENAHVSSVTEDEVSGNDYHESKAKIHASLQMGIAAEEDWAGPSVKPGDLTDQQVEWLASWLAGDGVIKP